MKTHANTYSSSTHHITCEVHIMTADKIRTAVSAQVLILRHSACPMCTTRQAETVVRMHAQARSGTVHTALIGLELVTLSLQVAYTIYPCIPH